MKPLVKGVRGILGGFFDFFYFSVGEVAAAGGCTLGKCRKEDAVAPLHFSKVQKSFSAFAGNLRDPNSRVS